MIFYDAKKLDFGELLSVANAPKRLLVLKKIDGQIIIYLIIIFIG
jgi:hypothetical protein